MRIDELKRIAKENDYTIERRYRAGCEEIVLYSHHYGIDRQVAVINNRIKNILFLSNGSCGEEDLNMIKASIKFAETPPEDREEEKKFYMKHKYFQDHLGSKEYFCIRISGGYPLLKSFPTPHADKIEFTLKEIEEIKKKFNTDLSDFKLVEVVDE